MQPNASHPAPVPSSGLILDGAGAPTWRYSSAYFAAKVRNSGISIHELERRCGLAHGYLHSALGLKPNVTRKRGKAYVSWRRTIAYELAEQLARALELDYHQAGV
jgi:hypothetical protein